jgi:hypothetical protein
MVRIDGNSSTNCGQRQKGMVDSRYLEPPLLDSFLQDEANDEAHLQDQSKGSGMVSVDDAMTNSGEV